MRIIPALVILAFTLVIGLPEAWAQNKIHYPIGKIIELEGSSHFINPDNNKKKLIKINDPVYMNATIRTGRGGKVLILFIDDTQIILAEETELVIDEFVFDPYDAEENEADFSIMDGSFHWFSGMISKRERPKVKIRTATGTIGIRGTEFWAGEIDNGYGVHVEEGRVGFSGDWGELDMPAGKTAFIPETMDKPDESIEWSEERRHRAYLKTTFTRQQFIEERLKEEKKANIRKRHDYRGYMFPYKKNPFGPGYKFDPDEFFTDEFLELQKGQRLNKE